MKTVPPSLSQPKFGKLYQIKVSPQNVSALREQIKVEAQTQKVDVHVCHKENVSRLLGFDKLSKGEELTQNDTLLVGTGKLDQWISKLTSADRTVSEAVAKYLIGSWSKPVMNSKLSDALKVGIVATGVALVTLAVVIPYKFFWLPVKCAILLAGLPGLISEWKERFQNWRNPNRTELKGDQLLQELIQQGNSSTEEASATKRFNVDQGQWEELPSASKS